MDAASGLVPRLYRGSGLFTRAFDNTKQHAWSEGPKPLRNREGLPATASPFRRECYS